MGTTETFNQKLGTWIEQQQLFFEDKNIQELLFGIINSNDKYGLFTEQEEEMVKKIFNSSMNLSFIINNNASQTDKLTQYLL